MVLLLVDVDLDSIVLRVVLKVVIVDFEVEVFLVSIVESVVL